MISATINKYCYIFTRYLPPFFDHNYRIRYTKREETKTIPEIQHPSVRECLKFLNIDQGIEMTHTSDLPAMSGLGSSSAFTVGFLHALYALMGKMVSKRQLALEAIHIEQDLIKENVGSQDQTAVAFGGFNKVEFGGDHKIIVRPIAIDAEKLNTLQNSLMLFFTGYSRNASDIAAEQIRTLYEKADQLQAMTRLAEEASKVLQGSQDNLDEFGRLLHENWQLKRTLATNITNKPIDEIYQAGIDAGALGGKLLGAGSGGFILFFVRPALQHKVKEKLKNLVYVPFKFENIGSQVVYYAPQESFK